MLLWLMMSFMFSIGFSIILASSPLSLGLWILLFALTIAFNISFSLSSWFALVLFLIYIGGMLVMFAYFSALTPNQPLEILKLSSMMFLTYILTIMFSFKFYFLNSTFSLSYNSFYLYSLFTPANVSVTLMMAIILFFILVAVVKIASINSGALRHFSYS